jgi:hypothetical protein
MRKWLPFLVFFLLTGFFLPIFTERVIYVGTIPLNGRIDLQERFELEIKQQSTLVFNSDIAGLSYEIATYDFYSNNSNISYQLKLTPSTFSEFGDSIFAFNNVDSQGRNTGALSIPFMLSVISPTVSAQKVSPKSRIVEKPIGVLDGSRYLENGTIMLSFPTQSEGFRFDAFASGFYEAYIMVEVSTD